MADKLEQAFGKMIGGGFKKSQNLINPKRGEKWVKKRF